MLVTLQMLSHLIPRKIFLADLSLPTCHSYFHSWRDALLSSVPQDAQGVSDFLLPSIHLSAVKTDFPRMMPWLAMWRWGESLLVFWLLSPPFAFWKRTHQLLGGVCCFSILLYGFLCLEIASLNLNSAHRLGLWYRTGWLVLGLLSPTCSAFSSCCLTHLSPLLLRHPSSLIELNRHLLGSGGGIIAIEFTLMSAGRVAV